MAARPKGAQVIKLDYVIDKAIYDDFVRICLKTQYAPKIVVERLLKKFNESGGQM